MKFMYNLIKGFDPLQMLTIIV